MPLNTISVPLLARPLREPHPSGHRNRRCRRSRSGNAGRPGAGSGSAAVGTDRAPARGDLDQDGLALLLRRLERLLGERVRPGGGPGQRAPRRRQGRLQERGRQAFQQAHGKLRDRAVPIRPDPRDKRVPERIKRRFLTAAKRRPSSLRRQPVGAFIHVVAVMAAHPSPLDPMHFLRCQNALPQIDVRHRIAGGILPALAHPTRDSSA